MSELALKLIAENKRTRSPFLDLGNCGLTEIPAEIGELVWLEVLSFASQWWFFDDIEWEFKKTQNNGKANQLAHLGQPPESRIESGLKQTAQPNPFASFVKLKALFLNGTNDKKSRLDNLSPLAVLENLQQLDISRTEVNNLSPLSSLVQLQILWISYTEVADLSPLSGLAQLQMLVLWHTEVTDLSPLSDLAQLQTLEVSHTVVTDLYPMLGLIKHGLPVKCSSSWRKGSGIYVKNCPLSNPPAEIAQQGNEAILNYFNEQESQGTAKLYEAKMLLIGDGGAGKTSLLRRLFQPEHTKLPEEQETTKGIAIHQHAFKTADQQDFRLNVWDFGGQEIYHATHQFFLTKRSLYVLLDDTRKDDKSVHDPSFKYWLEVADLLGDHSPVLIFQNEKGDRSKTIDESGIKGKFPNVQQIHKGNLAHINAADGIRKAVEFFAQNLPHIGEDLPARWVDIRADLERQSQAKPYISQEDYFGIYRQFLEFDRTKALYLSHYLHDLGVFLHFQDEPLLAKTVILQNTWATEAVFKMLDDETVKDKLGRFDDSDCQRVWQASAYADMHAELLALMQKFELCYLLPDKPNKHWLVPQLLPPSKPAALTDWQQAGDLCLRFRYEFLPKGIISRLIVRMHRFVQNPERSWISGALFERDGTQLLAEVPAKGGEILLRARGPERKELLSVIASDLDAMNEGFHGLKDLVSKWVPCLCSRCVKTAEPEFFKQERLLQRKRDGKLKVECPSSYEEVDVLAMLDGVNAAVSSSWGKVSKLFISYSKEDARHKDNLIKHLTGLRGKVVSWHDRDLLPGEEWDERIKEELALADVVVYLVSANSMATDYIQTVELPLVEQRCRNKQCVLIPVIVDFCLWTELEFAKYNALPEKGRVVTDSSFWINENQAWLKVVEGIKKIVEK